MKVQATIYKGIEFVSFHELPTDQQMLLQNNTKLERIKILVNGKIISNCIQYMDYAAWYNSVFTKPVPVKKQINNSVILSEVSVVKA